MKNPKAKSVLKRLDKRATFLRQKLGLSAPNRLLYRGRLSASESRMLLVEADGAGGAWASMVEGNHPFDYQLFYERHFDVEAEAVRVAKEVVDLRADPELVLQPATATLPSVEPSSTTISSKLWRR